MKAMLPPCSTPSVLAALRLHTSMRHYYKGFMTGVCLCVCVCVCASLCMCLCVCLPVSVSLPLTSSLTASIATASLPLHFNVSSTEEYLRDTGNPPMLHIPVYRSFPEGLHVVTEDFGMDVDVSDSYGCTALHVASWTGDLEVMAGMSLCMCLCMCMCMCISVSSSLPLPLSYTRTNLPSRSPTQRWR